MKALVTGAGGFIGSHLCEALIQRGYSVRAFTRYNSRNFWGWLEELQESPQLEVVAGDIRNLDIVKSAVRGVDVVFHLAALIGIPYSYSSPEGYVDTNIQGTLNVLQACRELGITRVVHTSTSEVYGTARSVPISEDHPLQPQSPYAASKASADLLALSFHSSFKTPVALIRPFNTYGPRQSARAVIPTIISQIDAGASEVRLGALDPTRDFTFVKDTVQGFIAVAESDKCVGCVTNIGSGFEITVGDLARKIISMMGSQVRIVSDDERMRPDASEVERLWADSRRAFERTGWKPKYALEEGLRETISWIQAHKKEFKAHMYIV